MFPKLSDLINYLLGTQLDLPVMTYGFFLAIAFLTAGSVLWLELKRKEKEGLLPARVKIISTHKSGNWLEIITGTLFSVILGYKFFGILFQYELFELAPQEYILSTKGNLVAAILILLLTSASGLRRYLKNRKKEEELSESIVHPYQQTWSILLVAIVSALFGSKLFDIVDNFPDFLRDPLGSLFSFSGFTFYGGLIVTVFTLIFYMRIIHLDWKQVIDAAAPAIMIGYAIGRMGCHLSGDGCWGIVNELSKPAWLGWLPDWAWSSHYPHNVIEQGIPIKGCIGDHCRVLGKPVWPTSLYESVASFLSWGILWIERKKMKAPVTLFGLFLILNGVERNMVERIRVNNRFYFLGLYPTQAEIISFTLVVLGLGMIWYYRKVYKKAPFDKQPDRSY